MTKWRNHIDIKMYFVDEPDDENVLDISEVVISQLRHIYKQEEKRNVDVYFLNELEEIIDNFDFVVHEIKEGTDSMEYEFSSWREAFNAYLRQLYDLGDTQVSVGDGSFSGREKFLWVG